MTENMKIGFIGAGNMAEAMIKGLLASEVKTELAVSDSSVERLEVIRTVYGIEGVSKDNKKVADFADVLVLAVKPQIISVILRQLKGRVRDKLIVSIAAGITTEYIESVLGDETRIVRVMPNTPALVLSGAAAVCGGKAATDEDLATVKGMLDAVGSCIIVDESKMDAVTGLSGSGPAYVYQFIEALSDAGVKMGLMRADATLLAAQTVMGAAQMVIETKKHPGELKDSVTSPGGTTICGLHELEKGGMRAAVMNAVEAATEKSKELGKRK
jgi:pyrroline-5-carboxylate reductase